MTVAETKNSIIPAYSETFVMFMKYYIIIAVICGIGYIIYKLLERYGIIKPFKKDNLQPEQEDNSTKEPTLEEGNKEQEIYYLYWTGGYDSTFRLCEMLLNEKKVVQPFYVSLPLDNDCKTEESCNKIWVRRNRKEEKQAMLKIRKELVRLYPKDSARLLPTIYIDTDIDDVSFNQAFEAKFYEDNLWPGKRKKHQYLFLSKFAYYHKLPIDIGVLGIHDKSKFANFLKENLVEYKSGPLKSKNYKIKQPEHFMEYLRFPLFGRTKTQLLAKGRKYGYDNILKYTWSCWFPNRKTSQPCGKCPMCKERVVSHPPLLLGKGERNPLLGKGERKIGDKGDGIGDKGDGIGDKGDGIGNKGDGIGDKGDGIGDKGDGIGDKGDGIGNNNIMEKVMEKEERKLKNENGATSTGN